MIKRDGNGLTNHVKTKDMPGIAIANKIDNIFSWTRYWKSPSGLALIGKMALWTTTEDEADDYYVDKIGVQDRQALTEGATAGVLHPGRAIRYDASETQYSKITTTPANFRLYNNSITWSTWLRVNERPSTGEGFHIGGTDPYATSGAFYATIDSSGKIYVSLKYTDGGLVTDLYDEEILELGKWYHISMIIDIAGDYVVKINNVECHRLTISGFSFTDFSSSFYVNRDNALSGIVDYRDMRLFSKALTDSEHTDLYNQKYVAGITSWWMGEEGKESDIYSLKDCVGVNHFINSGFTAGSLVSGSWPSLFNKFGYSQLDYESDDLILGDGIFDVPAEWAFTASRFAVADGVANFKAIDDLVPYITNRRTIVITAGDILKADFSITEGSATLYLSNQVGSALSTTDTYAVGSHSLVFIALSAATSVRITAVFAGGAFKMDNFTIKNYEKAFVSPKMDAVIPTTDILGRTLTFFDQAKYNLQKVDIDTVNLPDYVGEIFDACELIIGDDWYDTDGIGNEIDLVNIVSYESGRQYYNDEQLIIIKADAVLTTSESNKIKSYLGISDPFKLTVFWEEDYAQLDFVDSSGGVAQHEIEESLNGSEFSLVTTLDSGITTYKNRTWQNASMAFRVRSKIGEIYSDYSSIVSYQTPYSFQVDESTLQPITILTLQAGFGYDIHIDFGDGTSQDIKGTSNTPARDADNPMVEKNYTIPGQYWVTISGGTDALEWIHSLTAKDPYEGVPGSFIYGSMAKWLLPSKVYEIEIWWLPELTASDVSHWFPLPSCANNINIANCNFYGELNDPEWPNPFIEIYLHTNNFTGSALGSGIPDGAPQIGVDLSGCNFTEDLSTVALPANLVMIRLAGTIGFSGDLSGQSIPDGINENAPIHCTDGRIIDCNDCSFTKGYRGGFNWVQEYDFENNLFDSTELDNLLAYIDNYFTGVKVPLTNCVYTLSGTGMGIPSAAGLASKTSIEGKYTAEGLTATITVNS